MSGVVEITDHFERSEPTPGYLVSWEPAREASPPYEADFERLADAVAWARARAKHVFLDDDATPHHTSRYVLAAEPLWGATPWPERLPPAPEPVADHGGSAYIFSRGTWVELGYLGIHWIDGKELERASFGFSLEPAIDWGRARASVVLVETRTLSSDHQLRRFSAGEEEPPGESLPRLRPRPGETTMLWQASFADGSGRVVEAPTRALAEQLAVDQEVRRLDAPAGEGFTVYAPFIEPQQREP